MGFVEEHVAQIELLRIRRRLKGFDVPCAVANHEVVALVKEHNGLLDWV